MAAKWPDELTYCLDPRTFSETEAPQYIDTDIAMGPRLTRRVVNRGFTKVNAAIIVDKKTYEIFQTWWNRDVGGGAGSFNFIHPVTKENTTYKFGNPYKIDSVGPRNWRISMEWTQVGTTEVTTTSTTTEDKTMYYINLPNHSSTTIPLSTSPENIQVIAITPTTDLVMSTVPLTGTATDGTEVLLINVMGSGHTMKFVQGPGFFLNGDCVLQPGRSLSMVKTATGYYEKGRA